MRLDLLDTPIRVTTVDPGLVETEFSLVRFDGDAARAKKSYENLEALTGKDIAEVVVFAATRPPHVQIAEVIVFPTCQASTTHVHRGGLK
jgi:NADP-dependent 3-hydroxy acid dehydrogenase YdfG